MGLRAQAVVAASALSAAKSYPTSKVRDSSLECQAVMAQERLRGAAPCPRPGVMALRSHPVPKARGGAQEEPPCAGGQGLQPGGATPRLRPGAAAGRSNPRNIGRTGTGGPRGAIPR